MVFIGQAQDSKINGDISNGNFFLEFGLYSIGDPLDEKALKKSFKEAFSDLKLLKKTPEEITENTISFFQYENAQKDYQPGDLQYLQYFGEGLTDRQKQQLAKSNQATVFLLFGLKKDTWDLNKRFVNWLYTVSKDKAWIVYDGETRQYFTPDFWNKMRVETWTDELPYIPGQISIHSYRDGEFCRNISLGMQKFGLPDILINNSSCYNNDQFISLINILAQHISKNQSIYKDQILIDINKISNKMLRDEMLASLEDNAKKKVILALKAGTPEEGDPLNNLLEINFDNKNFESPQMCQEQIISDLFGFTEEVAHINHDDEILKASKEAKAKLPKLKELFNKGLDPGYTLLLKAPFEDDKGDQEWMWIEVTKWKDSGIKGILQNEPFYVKDLKAGSTVNANQNDIFDYILYMPDGSMEGNKTQELILKAQGR